MGLEGDRVPGDESIAAWQNYVPEEGGLDNSLGAAMPELGADVVDDKQAEQSAAAPDGPIILTIHHTPWEGVKGISHQGHNMTSRPYHVD